MQEILFENADKNHVMKLQNDVRYKTHHIKYNWTFRGYSAIIYCEKIYEEMSQCHVELIKNIS